MSAVGSIALLARTLPPLAATSASSGSSPSAVASTAYSSPLATVPQLGLLAFNDLQHLAAMLLLLSQAYGAALDTATGEATGPIVLSEALQLRAAARALMRDLVRWGKGGLDRL